MGHTTWRERWTILYNNLLSTHDHSLDDEDDIIGARLDGGGHGQGVWDARFGDKDLVSQGGLPGGQFGEIDVALCRLDNALYVRKAQPHRQALQATRERDVLLCARRTGSVWSPHLLCSYKESNSPNSKGPLTYTLVMSYVPGGTLEDVLESCVGAGGMVEEDVRWWFSQAVSAIGWLHQQGWAHRDIKPSNLAITSSKHLQILDFGCAAPISRSAVDSSSSPRRVLPYDDCLVPCGTCDYLSPEVLIWHETALARARANNADESEEEEDTWAQDWSEDIRSRVVDKLKRSVNGKDGDGDGGREDVQEGYGPETDWWSLGAMVYELAYGVAPFFAQDIATTYKKVLGHKNSLRFPANVASTGLENILRGLLTGAEQRLGRRSAESIKAHSYFKGTDWDQLHILPPPLSLVTPQFTYAPPVLDESVGNAIEGGAQAGFEFSALFQSTVDESGADGWGGLGNATGRTGDQGEESRKLTLRPGNTTGRKQTLRSGSDYEEEAEEQLGSFTWGPPVDAFDHAEKTVDEDELELEDVGGLMAGTPFRLKVPATPLSQRTPYRQPLFGLPSATPLRTSTTPYRKGLATPFQQTSNRHPMVTPFRQTSATPFRQASATPFHQAGVSYRQTSATPFRQLATATTPWRTSHTLRNSTNGFAMFKTPVRPGAMVYNHPGTAGFNAGAGPETATGRRTRAVTEAEALRQVLASARKRVYLGGEGSESSKDITEASGVGAGTNGRTSRANGRVSQASGRISRSEIQSQDLDQDGYKSGPSQPPLPPLIIPMFDMSLTSSEGATVPPSPSPSPRPGSAMSRRSATPSAMMAFGAATPSAMYSRSGSRLSVRATTPTWAGRGLRRDDSDEDEVSERDMRERQERVDKERREKVEREKERVEREREKVEKERRARLEKEEEQARKEEVARLKRQKEKGKERQRNSDEETETERRERDRADEKRGKEEARQRPKYSRENTPLEEHGPKHGREELGHRRLGEGKGGRRRGETIQLDQGVEAARLHELNLAEEMARMDQARRKQETQGHARLGDSCNYNGNKLEARHTDALRPTTIADSIGRRRVKSANGVADYVAAQKEPQPSTNDRGLESRAEPRGTKADPNVAPPPKTRTRSHHEPLLSSPIDHEDPRSMIPLSLDDVAGRQKRLARDVDALQGRIRDALRALQASKT